MKRYLYCGDTHGDLNGVAMAAEIARDHDAEIIQVGDWGFLWPNKRDRLQEGNKLAALSKILVDYGVVMRFIDGNHDWHEKLVPGEMAPNVIYQPRGSRYTDEDGTVFMFMGGAPSIDKGRRTDGVSWWATELITASDMANALSSTEPVDVLVTHDAPDYPPGYSPAGTPEYRALSTQSMNDIMQLVRTFRPHLHVHGHWHFRYKRGSTIGLDHTGAAYFSDCIYLWSRDMVASDSESA